MPIREVFPVAQTKALEEKLKLAEARIKEQEQIIRELELRKDQYDSIMENMQELVERSGPDYYLRYVNKSLANFYGVTQESLINTDTMNLVLKEDQQKIYELMENVDAENPYYHYEYRVCINDRIYWMESVGRGFYEDDGTIIEYQDVSRDVTHFKNMEEQLKNTVEARTAELRHANRKLLQVNDYLQSILSGISEGILVIDQNGDCEFLNYGPNDLWKSAAREICDYFRNLLNGKNSNVLNWMFLKKRAFTDAEMHFTSGVKDHSFVVSGMPLEAENEAATKGILVLKPMTQVHQMVTRMSGNQARFHFKDIVTTSPSLQETIFLAKQAAASDCNVMIEGESGTGKELFAQSIHNGSSRRNGPFVAVNCGAIPRELVASELFGYAEGSFTGAKKGGKPGKFELAEGGTLFLDEIGDMPLDQQIALLRVIQERSVTRVGGERDIPVDVRIISASNRNLRAEAKENNFREDLFYRLNVIGLHVPPLRDRKEDILPLFCSFWGKATGCKAEDFLKLLQPEVIDALSRYDWPGNVRELENVADRMMYLSGGKEITVQYLPHHILKAVLDKDVIEAFPAKQNAASGSIQDVRAKRKEATLSLEQQRLFSALERAGGNISAAARDLGISRATFYRKLRLSEEDGS